MTNPARLILTLILAFGFSAANANTTTSFSSEAYSSRRYTELPSLKTMETGERLAPKPSTALSRLDFTQGIFFGALAFLIFLCILVGVWFSLSLIVYYGLFATCIGVFHFLEEGLFFDFTAYPTVFRSQNVPMIVWAAGWVSFLTFSARFFKADEKKKGVPFSFSLPFVLVGITSIISLLLQKWWMGFILPVFTSLPFLFIWLPKPTKQLKDTENGKLLPYLVGMLGLLVILLSYALGSHTHPISEKATHWRIGGMFLVFSSFNLAILSHFKQEIRDQYLQIRWRMQHQKQLSPALLMGADLQIHPKAVSKVPVQTSSSQKEVNAVILRNGVLLEPSEVAYFFSERHYVQFFFNDPLREPIRIRSTFSEVLEKFLAKGFIQTHRCYAVNIYLIHRYLSTEIQLQNGATVPVSRSYKVARQKISSEL